jgi:hypothetical protein
VDDPFDDLDNLRLTPEDIAAIQARAAPTPRRRRQQPFTKFPRSWENRMQTVRHASSYRVALYLLYQTWKADEHLIRPIRLSNTALAELGVSRWAKWRALRELERVGLIRVEERPRKSPLIHILVS